MLSLRQCAFRHLNVRARFASHTVAPPSQHLCRSHRIAACSSKPPSAGKGPGEEPWYLGFQCNERYLQWDYSAQRELIRIYLCKKLDLTEEQLIEQLAALATLLPDMMGKLENCKANILEALLADLPGLAGQLLDLKQLMPNTNISGLVSRYPALVLQMQPSQVAAQLQHLKQHLPGVDVERLVADEPALLRVDITKVLAEIRRLLPKVDPVRQLLANPGLVLDMDSAGLASSIEKEGELMDDAMLSAQ